MIPAYLFSLAIVARLASVPRPIPEAIALMAVAVLAMELTA